MGSAPGASSGQFVTFSAAMLPDATVRGARRRSTIHVAIRCDPPVTATSDTAYPEGARTAAAPPAAKRVREVPCEAISRTVVRGTRRQRGTSVAPAAAGAGGV